MLLVRRVVGKSMLPAFRPGTIVFGHRFRRPRIGDVVVAVQDGREIIKRVAGIGSSRYFLLGDNPAVSTDSRTYGWLNGQAIKAIVAHRWVR